VAQATTTVGLTALRELAALALAPADAADPPVMVAPVDSLDPPALMLAWDDPMLSHEMASLYRARLAVVCFAGRVEPDAGIATLEWLIDYVIGRLRADAYSWPYETTRAPRLLEVAGVPLLSARVVYSCPVTGGG
jgi:hypothetical protein